ncbi:MAG TPA: NUDIX hydrolase [Aggregatilineales bacterium]|nr:NUDIX hydrolase [Aggregatilineales bacterium]
MSHDSLMRVLRAIQPPAGVEEWFQTDSEPQAPASTHVPGDYQRGVRDVLAALGVLDSDRDAPSTPNAYYFLRSLLSSLHDNALGSGSWQGGVIDGCAGTGARLLRVLEENRLDCCQQPTPLRVVRAVTAVIKARQGNSDVYLMQYDGKARQFQPLGGKQETFDADEQAALTRELCEELQLEGLRPGVDFQLHPLAQRVRFNEVSASLNVLTQYDHSFFHLTDVRFRIPNDGITRWIAADELAAGITDEGQAVTRLFEEAMPGALAALDYSMATL